MQTTMLTCGRILALVALVSIAGCAHVANHYVEDGPWGVQTRMHPNEAWWDSPTVADIKQRFEPSKPRTRHWDVVTVSAECGTVSHWPLWFEDPFEDKSHGRIDETHPGNVYRFGWEDWVAAPYGISRFTLNWLLFPASVLVTPPWTVHESDGAISKQMFFYDHDAARAPYLPDYPRGDG